MGGERARPGRPRKWASNAERMRAYRAARHEREARLVDPVEAPEVVVENLKLRTTAAALRERVAQLEAERDRLWIQVVGLQDQIRDLLRNGRPPMRSAPSGPRPLSRSERRQAEREAARRRRHEEH